MWKFLRGRFTGSVRTCRTEAAFECSEPCARTDGFTVPVLLSFYCRLTRQRTTLCSVHSLMQLKNTSDFVRYKRRTSFQQTLSLLVKRQIVTACSILVCACVWLVFAKFSRKEDFFQIEVTHQIQNAFEINILLFSNAHLLAQILRIALCEVPYVLTGYTYLIIFFFWYFPLALPFINTEQTPHYRDNSDLLNSSLKVLFECRLINICFTHLYENVIVKS